MPSKIQDKTIKKVEDIIKKEKLLNKSKLIQLSNVGSKYIDDILDILSKQGKVLIAKHEIFNQKGDLQVYACDIKWTGN
jgi:predicted transcriptional regulator